MVKDECDPDALRRLRGPEDSLVYSSQLYHPSGQSYPSPTSTLLPPPVSSTLVSFSHGLIGADKVQRSVRGNYSYGNNVPYTNLPTSPVVPLYQSAMPIAMQSLAPLQKPASLGYNSCTSTATPGSQRHMQQSAPSSPSTAQFRQKAPGSRPTSKTSTSSSATQGSHSSNTPENEGRTVYLYNLPYTVSQQAIKEHVASAGVVDRCLVKEDRQRSSKYKLTAVVTFRTPQQAQTAIGRFNRSTWKGYEIKVKLDRGPTASGVSANGKGKSTVKPRAREDRRETREGPLVVNGSGPSISSRQTRVDSDDESSCDEGKQEPRSNGAATDMWRRNRRLVSTISVSACLKVVGNSGSWRRLFTLLTLPIRRSSVVG
jgi:RNA recognition motif. (a.k.a. RRM, RBD, or RNP domain)